VNIYLGSPALYYAPSIIGVFVFVGRTAHDTQAIKELYLQSEPDGLRGSGSESAIRHERGQLIGYQEVDHEPARTENRGRAPGSEP
jgi:hypothetical protein